LQDEATKPLAELRAVSKHYHVRLSGGHRGILRAVDGVNLTIPPGTTVGLVGESGSGKSTLGRILLRLVEPTEGEVHFEDRDITKVNARHMRSLRQRMQLVLQDPYSAFDPIATITDSISEAVRGQVDQKADRIARSRELLATVGLNPDTGHRHSRDVSGGQLQRAAIARALAVSPSLMVLDEPVSSLDVSSRAHIINLLNDLQTELGVAYLFITHDLSVVRDVSHTIAVMYLGRLVESGPADELYSNPRHPYTRALLSAIPRIDPSRRASRNRIILTGDQPSPISLPSGCRFHPRCPKVMDICRREDPPTVQAANGYTVACHLHTVSGGVPASVNGG
jgi:oligopeptide/dipeptide ABC transporter ATP-binding protein